MFSIKETAHTVVDGQAKKTCKLQHCANEPLTGATLPPGVRKQRRARRDETFVVGEKVASPIC
jgi:hypothetical protein